jgi:hypothetical protein
VRTAKIALIATVLASLVPGVLRAAVITVPDGSFETPTVPPPALPFYALNATPATSTPWTGTGGNNTGIFPNLAMDTNYGGVIAKRITNADGNQLAFIGAIYDPNGTTDAGVPVVDQIYQQLPTVYAAGQSYTLSAGVAISSVQPPDTGSHLRLELYYLSNGNMIPVASTLLTNDTATSLQNDSLNYFTVQTPVTAANAPYLNQPIGVLISTTDNTAATGGTYDLDNITVSATPEPGSVALLGMGLLAIGTRRRRSS